MPTITRVLSVTTVAAIASAVAAYSAPAATMGADYFRGKTVTYIVSTAPGGGSDFYGRMMARHMELFLPESTFIVRNVPGAGHIIGLNLIYVSKPNGLTIGTFTTGVINSQIVGQKGMRADLTKMSWIGKQSSDIRVVYMSSVAPFKSWDDLVNAKRRIVLGASGVGSGAWDDAHIVANAWNLNVRVLPGYSGQGGILAMLRGEFDGRVGSLSSQLAISSMDPGKVVLQFGNKLPNVPKAVDVAVTPLQKTVTKLLRAKGELNRIVAGPPAIPKDRLEALRETFRKAHMSEQYRDFARKARRPVDDVPLVGEDVANMIKDAVEVGPELTALIKQVTLIQPKLIKHKGKVSKLENGNRKVSIMYEGKEVSAGISGSRTAVKVGGKTAKRKAIEIGMTCEFIYVRPGAEAKAVDCE